MPPLEIAAFEKDIHARRLAPLYLIHGEDVRTAERLVDLLEATIDEGDRPFAVDRLYAAETGGQPIDIAAAARSLPMLGDRRLVIVLRAERLLKPKRASRGSDAAGAAGPAGGDDGTESEEADGGDAADATPLEEYVAAPVPSNTVVFVASEIDRSRRLTKRIVDAARVIECRGLVARDARGREAYDPAEAERQARQALATAGRTIVPDGLRLLLEAAAGEIGKLRDDIERLVLFVGDRREIAAADVAAVTSGHGWIDDWGLTNAVEGGRVDRALVEVAQRLDRGDSPHAMLGQLRWWVANRLVNAEPDRVKPAIEALLRTDLALKSSGGDERVLIERLVLDLTKGPVRAARSFGGRR